MMQTFQAVHSIKVRLEFGSLLWFNMMVLSGSLVIDLSRNLMKIGATVFLDTYYTNFPLQGCLPTAYDNVPRPC